MFSMYSVGNKRTIPKEPVSLLDSKEVKLGAIAYADQMKELIPFEENIGAVDEAFNVGKQIPARAKVVPTDPNSVLDEMIQANVLAFSGSGLVKRK